MSLITTTSELSAFIDRLSGETFVTVDTEFIREKTYWPRLCLVQLGGSDEAHCIDPLAKDMDLEPLFALMRNPAILKVFHAARQDLEIFLHLMGDMPQGLYDTQIAAMVCGFGESVGYETLVIKLAKAKVDKSMRFTDWARRPLDKKQLAYALGDVTHLRVIYEALRDQLEASGRTNWVEREMEQIADPGLYLVEPNEAYKRIKARTKSPKFLTLLKELAAWRERTAQEKDLPRNRVLKDEGLLEVAAHPATTPQELLKLRSISKGIAEGPMGRGLIEAVERAQALPKDQWPQPGQKPDLPQGLGPVTDLLRVLLKMQCEAEGVAPRLVASSADLELIAANDEADVPALSGWRRELFGEAALKLKRGEMALALTPDLTGLRLIPVE
ncbi:MAG: ribonuclease D [Rhodospirillaceae bacterium]